MARNCVDGHRYEKFNEVMLFCKRCGTTKTINHGYTYTYWPRPYWPWGQPYWFTNTSGTTSSVLLDTNVTYTGTGQVDNSTWLADALTLGDEMQKDAKSPVQPPTKGKTIKGTADPEKKT